MDLLGAGQQEDRLPDATPVLSGYRSNAKPNMPVAIKDKKKAAEKPIWEEKEFKAQSGIIVKEEDDRIQPEYEILFQQNVGSEDVFLNLGQRDGSSDHCTHILVKISLPDTQQKDISLDILEERLLLQAPKHRLNLALPYRVKKDQGNAKWDSLRGELAVTLVINQKVKYFTKLEELVVTKK